jgi:hypothetical protein
VAILENTFTWSASRHASFLRCHREYWWQYYGAWGGWNTDASPEAREAYVLKNLSNRWAWVGSAVHSVIEQLLRRLSRQATEGHLDLHGGVDVEAEMEATTRALRAQFRESRSGAYRLQPKKRFGLSEHEYADVVTDDEWRAMNQKAREAVRGFLESPVFAMIRASDPRTWFPIEEMAQFDFEGVGVWAVLDFAMRRPDGGADIYDWKTGIVDPEGNRLQLVCYGLYMEQVHGVPLQHIRNHLVYLGPTVTVHEFAIREEDVAAARHAMRESIARMRARLTDAAGNAARREDFAMTDDLTKCAVCTFRRLCGRG